MKKLCIAFVLMFILSSVSALAAFQIDSAPEVVPFPTDPGTSVNLRIRFSNLDATNPTTITVQSTNPFGGGVITLGTVALTAGQANRLEAFSIPVPSNQAQGNYPATVTAFESSTSNATAAYTIGVNPKPGLAVTESSVTLAGQPGATLSRTFTVQNTGNTALSNVQVGHERAEIKDENGNVVTVSFSPATISSLAVGASQTVTVTAVVPTGYDIRSESDRIKLDVLGLTSVFVPLTIDVKPLVCSAGNIGRLDVDIITPESNDDIEAGTLIAVEIDVENKDSRDHDVILEAVLYNLDEEDVLDDFDDDRNIDNGETETFKFNLQLPSDTDEDDDVRLYVKAFVEGSEGTHCIQQDLGFDVQELENKVVIESLTLSPETPVCGQTVFGTVHVVNRDNDEQDVVVTIRSDELSILKQLPLVTLDEGFTRGSEQFQQFSFVMPQTARAGSYILSAIANYEDGATSWQRTFNVGQCTTTGTGTTTPPAGTGTTTPPTTSPPTVITGKSVWDRLGEVPVGFWLLANLVLAVLIFVLAFAALRSRKR